MKLENSVEWLRLGHWRKSLGGYRSDADGDAFFLSPHGRSNPRDELLATIEAFSISTWTDSIPHPQCRFLARRRFLESRLGRDRAHFPWRECQTQRDWIRKLDASKVSVVFASSYMNNAASMFGHTFLKLESLENAGGKELLDYGVSFFAETGPDDGLRFALFGLIGHYRGHFSLEPYHETLKTYADLEGRDVWEYELSLTPTQVEILVEHLLELEQTHFDYFFVDENCSYQLLSVLDVVAPNLDLADRFLWAVSPADTMRVLSGSPGLVHRIVYRPSLMTRFEESRKHLDASELALAHALVTFPTSDNGNDLAELEERIGTVPPEQRSKILDTSLLYAELQSHRGPNQGNDELSRRSHQLKIWRARLGKGDSIDIAPPMEKRPEAGHDPALAGVGVGTRDGKSYQAIQLRYAYHHLLSNDTGYLPGTQMEILRLDLRRKANDSAPSLHSLTLMDLFSSSPSTRFFQPRAWRLRLAVERPDDPSDEERLALTGLGGVGYTVTPLGNYLHLTALLQGHAEAGPGFSSYHRLGASVRLQALTMPVPELRIVGGLEHREYFSGERKSVPRAWMASGLSLTRNLELRLETHWLRESRDSSALLLTHFLL